MKTVNISKKLLWQVFIETTFFSVSCFLCMLLYLTSIENLDTTTVIQFVIPLILGIYYFMTEYIEFRFNSALFESKLFRDNFIEHTWIHTDGSEYSYKQRIWK